MGTPGTLLLWLREPHLRGHPWDLHRCKAAMLEQQHQDRFGQCEHPTAAAQFFCQVMLFGLTAGVLEIPMASKMAVCSNIEIAWTSKCNFKFRWLILVSLQTFIERNYDCNITVCR